jgi:hypothetical protein
MDFTSSVIRDLKIWIPRLYGHTEQIKQESFPKICCTGQHKTEEEKEDLHVSGKHV